MKPTLSILICSIKSRASLLNTLMGELINQCQDLGLPLTGDEKTYGRSKIQFRDVYYGVVEILTATDNKEIPTGTKRNMLVKRAKGVYVVFIDDDDWIPKYYISEILLAARTNTDCIAINGVMTTNGGDLRKWFIDTKYGYWRTQGNVYLRTPNHISPIKREIVLQVLFPDKTSGEDSDFSARVLPLLKTQSYILQPMYVYRFSTQKK